MKNKYFSLRNILIISMFIIFSQTCVYSQLIRNYSFEFRHDTCLPYGISPSYMGGSIPGYDRSELMRCIGYCENHNIWSPVSSSNICDENSSYPFPLNGGWYLPTNCGSTDYFHVLGTLGAGSEEIYVFKYGQGIKYPEKRYPAGWSSDSYNADSAFIGFAMRAKKPGSGLSNVSAKEYIQSKLTEPLIGPAFYEVSFMVSRSNYSPAIHSLGALFTYNSVVNPIGYYDFLWEWNLSRNSILDNNQFYNKPQICSKALLNSTADEHGFGGWQTIVDTLYVPDNTIYNYITLGNFQNDSDFWNDIDSSANKNANWINLYYFLDRVTIEPLYFNECICNQMFIHTKIERQIPSSDSTKCCYDYSFFIYDTTKFQIAPVCPISRYKILKDTTVIVDSASTSDQFPIGYYQGSFCLEKFNTDNDDFTILFYKRENGHDTLINNCTRTLKLKCLCDCSDVKNNSIEKGKLQFKMIKVDSSASGRCCWDLIMINPITDDSTSCEYDLSGKSILISNNPYINYYEFIDGEFPYLERFNSLFARRWQIPDPYISKPGDTTLIGQICTTNLFEEITLSFILSNSHLFEEKCDTILTKKFTCDTTETCCDNWELKVDSLMIFSDPDFPQKWDPYCGGYLHLYYNETPAACDYYDSLIVNVNATGANAPINWNFELQLKDVYQMPINISPFLLFDDSLVVCIQIINKRTLDTCNKCITLRCIPDIIIPDSLQMGGGELFRNSSSADLLTDDMIKIIPHPIDNKFDVILNSINDENCMVTMNDIYGSELLKKDFTLRKGTNKLTVTDVNLPTGTYFVNIKRSGTVRSVKVLISR